MGTPLYVTVWGKEPGDTEVSCLFSFPVRQWTDKFAKQLLKQLEDRGVTDVEVRKPAEGK